MFDNNITFHGRVSGVYFLELTKINSYEFFVGRIILFVFRLWCEQALCHRLCILVNGQLKCIGTPQHLKTKFGTGYQFDVTFKDDDIETRLSTEKGLSEKFDFRVLEVNGEKATYELDVRSDYVGKFTLAKLFDELELIKSNYPIEHYAVNQTTLEQVFLKMARAREDELESELGKVERENLRLQQELEQAKKDIVSTQKQLVKTQQQVTRLQQILTENNINIDINNIGTDYGGDDGDDRDIIDESTQDDAGKPLKLKPVPSISVESAKQKSMPFVIQQPDTVGKDLNMDIDMDIESDHDDADTPDS